jgi:GT2 family glycosyltransferase
MVVRLREVEPGIETLLVDNGSTADSVEVFSRLVPDGRVIRLGENRRFAAAANACAREAANRYVAFLNTGTEPRPGSPAALRASSATRTRPPPRGRSCGGRSRA